ncbi:thiopeptide-type bacteriocin biosynthesis protein [Pseudofrankia sp. DC12]|uniref:thiopeptide-type bacteriocin biosynthesis protein n=1 Tax=Pseudofrankia sp. DC12 TaxID=683315 RepID=UPI0012FC4524|nr:thiopeptide-type bacteriocin biosynthesis protein [Pseudofrankia sp. DC12]
MPVVSVGPLVDAVRVALAGGDLCEVAAAHGLATAQLTAAISAYHEAGTAALTRPGDRWYASRLMFPTQTQPEKVMADVVAPALDSLCSWETPVDWWFLRRESDWRVHVRHPDPAVLGEFLHDLGKGRPVAATQPALHEPDVRPFGGMTGTLIAYEFFVADSRGILEYARRTDPLLGRRDLSIAIVDILLAAAGLTWIERGDVYTQLAVTSPPYEAAEPIGARQLGVHLHTFLSDPATRTAIGGAWVGACATAGQRLADAAAGGLLTSPITDVLAALIRPHWARLGLPAPARAVLVRAATEAYNR